MSTLADQNQVSHHEASTSGGGFVQSDPAIIRRVEIMCALYEMAYEMKSLELGRRYPNASLEWIRRETFRLIEAGTK